MDLLYTALKRYYEILHGIVPGLPVRSTMGGTIEHSNFMNGESDLVEPHKSQPASANAAINTLPPEIFLRIFHLILSQQPCCLSPTRYWYSQNSVRFPKYPDIFSHVCSQWRHIALASPGLWSHVDIALSGPFTKGFHDRAAAYVARTRRGPIDIHLVDPGPQAKRLMTYNDTEPGFSEPDGNNPAEFTFLGSSSEPWVRSLTLVVHHRHHPIHNRALEHCLANCLPGGLSKLALKVPTGSSPHPNLFEANVQWQNRENTTSAQLLLSEQRLESAWLSATSLMLEGRYPRWASMAYHRLMDLRLTGRKFISGPELAGILQSSPELRTIRCDFIIRDSPRLDTLSLSIPLQGLETLNLRGMDQADVEYFLRWLQPGPERMRLSLSVNPDTMLQEFFERSNVQEMRVITKLRTAGEALPPNMYCLPPQLRVFALVDWGRGWSALGSARIGQAAALLSSSKGIPLFMNLDVLYMVSCHFDDFSQFQRTVAKYSPRKLVLWGCEVGYSHRSRAEINMTLIKSALGDDLSLLCPFMECLTIQDPVPCEDWD